jgi:transcriptional regulator with XRE-family HTH domain
VTDFSSEVRRLMAARGMSLRGLARAAHCDVSHLSRVLNGHKAVSADLAAAVDDALEARGEIRRAAAGPAAGGSVSPEARDRLAWAARHPGRADAQVIDALAGVLAAQRLLEDRIGSAPMLEPVAAQVAAAENLAADAPAELRSRVLDIAAQYNSFRAWLDENTGRLQQAIRVYDRALGQAAETGDVNLLSELLSMKGHVAWTRGDHAEAVRLSQAAQRDRAAHPSQHAISAMQEARALAVLGDAPAVGRKLAGADRAEEAARDRAADRPPWLYYHSPGFFSVQRGRAWLHLGAHDPAYNRRAVGALASGIAQLDGVARESEWGASYLLYLARAHMQAGDAEEACAVALEAASAARRLSSAPLLARVRRLHARMARRWPGHPGVAALGETLC